ncbi:MAG: SHOCT domain-containing protein [Candidatus Limnocylindria bacterium]
MGGYSYGFAGWMMLLFWIFIIALIVWLVLTVARSQHQRRFGEPAEGSGRRILQERLARGEIAAEEYRERLAVLTEGQRR